MKAKKWIIAWIIIFIFLTISSFVFIFYLHNYKNVPLRFSNSISFDAKISFLKKSVKFNNSEIIIVGSSMGLNNVNSRLLAKKLKNENIVNISSWGLKVHEIVDLLKIIDLSNVKKVLYLNKYFDFYGKSIDAYDKDTIQKYLYSTMNIKPYINAFNSLNSNFKDYIFWKKRYLDSQKYSSLEFNSYGDVLLDINRNNINAKRWENFTDVSKLSNHYNSLVVLIKFLSKKNIDLYVINTPHRKIFFNNAEFLNQYNKHIKKIEELSLYYNFKYLNLQDVLSLGDNYFVDESHLNKSGADKVANEISKVLHQNIK